MFALKTMGNGRIVKIRVFELNILWLYIINKYTAKMKFMKNF